MHFLLPQVPIYRTVIEFRNLEDRHYSAPTENYQNMKPGFKNFSHLLLFLSKECP